MTPTESLLKELEELEAKCLPDELVQRGNSVEPKNSHLVSFKIYGSIEHMDSYCRLLVASRNSLPALLQIIKMQREALEFYAPEEHWACAHEHTIDADSGRRARETLSRCDEIAKGVEK